MKSTLRGLWTHHMDQIVDWTNKFVMKKVCVYAAFLIFAWYLSKIFISIQILNNFCSDNLIGKDIAFVKYNAKDNGIRIVETKAGHFVLSNLYGGPGGAICIIETSNNKVIQVKYDGFRS